jgi:hypothetical protein
VRREHDGIVISGGTGATRTRATADIDRACDGIVNPGDKEAYGGLDRDLEVVDVWILTMSL